MDRPLKDMVILVTGGAKRVGAAVCRRLHAAGASVMVHYRASEADARALVAELGGARPHSAALTQADLLKEGAAVR
ncbi:MAG: SDR family NAD(P)-dependent oxidoreductase, partial [Betaproteobacteria bacterium]|nr:SDR family NAD(P)-dependent oxidoreductase [Betaproteobacteria bacterium]